MTIERPMFPPRAESDDSFFVYAAVEQRPDENPPGDSPKLAEGLYRRTDISPEQFFQALGRVRRAARDEIERLIEWLDSTIDCDQDARPTTVPAMVTRTPSRPLDRSTACPTRSRRGRTAAPLRSTARLTPPIGSRALDRLRITRMDTGMHPTRGPGDMVAPRNAGPAETTTSARARLRRRPRARR